MKNINTMNGKRFLLSATIAFLLLLMINPVANAQVGIGTATPNASAALDVTSTSKGFLMPRLTTAQRNTLTSTAVNGLMVVDTELKAVMIFVDGAWTEVGGGVKQQAQVLNQNDVVTLTGISSVLGVWEEQSAGTAPTSGNINYTTSGDYNLGSTTYVEVTGGNAQMKATVPGYSADLCTEGTPFGDQYSVEYGVINAFDDNIGTEFLSLLGLPSTGSVSQVLGFEFSTSKVITQYTFRTGATDGVQPKNWVFEGWNGSSWVTLDTKIDQILTISTLYSYPIVNSTAYSKYQIKVTKSKNAGWEFMLSEFEMKETMLEYQTSTAYNVTTKAASNLDANFAEINSIVVTGTNLTDCRFAFSFNEGTDWYKYDGGWSLLANLSEVATNGNTEAQVEALSNIIVEGSNIDIAVALKTSSATTNAVVSNIEISYDYNTGTFYQKLESNEYQISRTNATGKQDIKVKKLSVGNGKNVVIDYIK